MERAKTFINDDQSYIDYREMYPHGYVLNVYKSGKWITLHRASCGVLNKQVTYVEGTFTGRLAYKICGLSERAIREEAQRLGIDWFSICGCLLGRTKS